MILYGNDASPFVARVRIQLAHKGLPVELVPPPGGPGSAQMRGIHALGRIPVLDDEGRRIPESAVIAEYLEDRYPVPGLRGRTPGEAADVRLVCRVIDLYLVPALQPFRAALIARRSAAPGSGSRDGAGEEVSSDAVAGFHAALAALEACLAAGPFAASDSLSLADCALAPMFLHVDRLAGALLRGFRRDAWPRLDACVQQLAAQPDVAGVLSLMASAMRPPPGAPAQGARA